MVPPSPVRSETNCQAPRERTPASTSFPRPYTMNSGKLERTSNTKGVRGKSRNAGGGKGKEKNLHCCWYNRGVESETNSASWGERCWSADGGR